MESKKLTLSLRTTVKAYSTFFSVLLCCNFLAMALEHLLDFEFAWGFVPLFHFDSERNIPTLFSVLLIIQSAILCAVIGKQVRHGSFYWWLLSIIFAFLALDEFASIHEQLIPLLRANLPTSGFFYFAWMIPYGIAVLTMAIPYAKWLYTLPSRTRHGLIGAALLYLVGVFVIEGASGWYLEGNPGRDLTFDLMATAEESCEMLGLLVFSYVVFLYLHSELRVQGVRWQS